MEVIKINGRIYDELVKGLGIRKLDVIAHSVSVLPMKMKIALMFLLVPETQQARMRMYSSGLTPFHHRASHPFFGCYKVIWINPEPKPTDEGFEVYKSDFKALPGKAGKRGRRCKMYEYLEMLQNHGY